MYKFQERKSSITTFSYQNGIKSSQTETSSETKSTESSQTFQPLQPFKPFTTFEAPQPFESLKSFELVKQVEDNFSQIKDGGGELPAGYEPVKALSPLKLYELEPIFNIQSESTFSSSIQKTSNTSQAEIKEENIKNTLKEIILDLDNFVERDKELKESKEEQNSCNIHIPTIVLNGGPPYPKLETNQVGGTKIT